MNLIEFLLYSFEIFLINGGYWALIISYLYSKRMYVFQGFKYVMKNDILRNLIFTSISAVCFYSYYMEVNYYLSHPSYEEYLINIYTYENSILLFIGLVFLIIGNKKDIIEGYKIRWENHKNQR